MPVSICLLEGFLWETFASSKQTFGDNRVLTMGVCAHDGLGVRFKCEKWGNKARMQGGIPTIALEKLALFSGCIDLDFTRRVPWRSPPSTSWVCLWCYVPDSNSKGSHLQWVLLWCATDSHSTQLPRTLREVSVYCDLLGYLGLPIRRTNPGLRLFYPQIYHTGS